MCNPPFRRGSFLLHFTKGFGKMYEIGGKYERTNQSIRYRLWSS